MDSNASLIGGVAPTVRVPLDRDTLARAMAGEDVHLAYAVDWLKAEAMAGSAEHSPFPRRKQRQPGWSRSRRLRSSWFGTAGDEGIGGLLLFQLPLERDRSRYKKEFSGCRDTPIGIRAAGSLSAARP